MRFNLSHTSLFKALRYVFGLVATGGGGPGQQIGLMCNILFGKQQ